MFTKTTRFCLLSIISIPIIFFVYFLIKGFTQNQEILLYFNNNYLYILANSIKLSSLTSLASTILGFIVAICFYSFENIKYRFVFIFLLIILFTISPMILMFALSSNVFFSSMSSFFQSLSIGVWHFLPLCSLIMIFTISAINYRCIEVASFISNKTKIIQHIIIPQVKRQFMLTLLLIFILSWLDQSFSSMLGYNTYSQKLLEQISIMNNIEDIVASALPSYLFVIILFFSLKQKYNSFSRNYIKKLKLSNHIFGHIWLTILSLSLFYILFSIVQIFINEKITTSILVNISVFGKTIFLLFVLSFIATTISLIVHSTIFKYYKKTIIFLFLFYLLTPHFLTSLIISKIYQYSKFLSTFGDYVVFCIGYLFVLLPIAFFLFLIFANTKPNNFYSYPKSISIINKFIKITIPQILPYFIFIQFAVMVFALNELSVPIILIPPGFEISIIRIYNLLHYGDTQSIAFLAILQIFFILFCCIGIFYFFKRTCE